MPRKPVILAKLELQLMKVIWEKGEATVQQVKDALQKKRPLAYSTVLTMLRKLEQKGLLTHTVNDRTYVYQPLVKEEEVTRNMLDDLLERLFNGSREMLLNTLIEDEDVTPEDLDALKAKIDEWKRKKEGAK